MKTEHREKQDEQYMFQDGAEFFAVLGMVIIFVCALLEVFWKFGVPFIRQMMGG